MTNEGYGSEYDYDYFYDEDLCETCLPNGYEPPKKGDLGLMLGAALWQVAMPMFVFHRAERKAYREHFGEEEPEDFELDMETITWKTKEMKIWDMIWGFNFLLWTPMLFFGGPAYFGIFQEPAAWWL